MSKKYDVAIAYRIYPGYSKPTQIYNDDKLKFSVFCLKSLVRSLTNVNAFFHVIFDGCPKEYVNEFDKILKDFDREFKETDAIGNGPTFDLQCQYLMNQNKSDLVYFAEDDYYFLDDSFKSMIDFMRSEHKPDFVTGYDHIHYYEMNFHKEKSKKVNFNNTDWYTRVSTTLSFMTYKDTLKETYHVFKSYLKKNYDASIWMILTGYKHINPIKSLKMITDNKLMFKTWLKCWYYTPLASIYNKKYTLFTPSPGLCNHMEIDGASPDVNWEQEFEKYKEVE